MKASTARRNNSSRLIPSPRASFSAEAKREGPPEKSLCEGWERPAVTASESLKIWDFEKDPAEANIALPGFIIKNWDNWENGENCG
jgi:hypothetical protein